MKPLDCEEYRSVIEHASTMVWRAGLDGTCDYFNPAWLSFTGHSPKAGVNGAWLAGVHPDDYDDCLALYLDRFARRESFEIDCRLCRHDGVYRHVLGRGVPYEDADGAFAGFVGSCLDVDDYRSAEAAPGAVEFFEMSLDNLCVTGLDGHFRRLSPSWTKTLGWSREELMSKPSIELVHPEDRPATLAARAGLGEGIPLIGLINRYQCKDQTYRWFEWRSVSRVDQGLVYAAARDVTEQKEATRVLRELTDSLTTTLNSIADGVIAVDADGVVSRMNPVAEKLAGWSSAEAQGKPIEQVFSVVDGETRLVRRDGTELPIASSRATMRGVDGIASGAVLVFRDMTSETEARELKEQLQRQLVFADRMASVGTLAAGVAHEINNPLAYVMANLEILLEELKSVAAGSLPARTAEWADMAVEAREGAERIRKIVRGLKTFSRAEEERRAVIDVRPVLELAINMAFNEIRHRARLVKDYGDVPLVEADDARLGQVFINLLVNATQAFPEGGVEANEIRVLTSTDATGRAVIEVSDNGPGIPDSMMDRVFDPFFTTKPIGVGTGLGLSICHNIVTGMGGEITVRGQEGHGAVFRIVLPAAPDRHARRVTSVPPPERTGKQRRLTVLVVDDEPAVGGAIGRLLSDHDVTVVATAKEALDSLTSDRRFDVVVSDLMMPEMSGMDLYDELVRRGSPAAERMVFVTGGAFTSAARGFLDRVPNERLEKPFAARAMRELVQRVATQLFEA